MTTHMNTYWNMLYLERPPRATWEIKQSSTKDAGVNVESFKHVLDSAIKDFNSMFFIDVLHKEAAVLSRLIYRMKNKFRNDKGLRSMITLNKTLIHYYNMFLPKAYENLQSIIEMEDESYILPSKQMVEYVLVRTQGFANLMAKIGNIARITAYFFRERMSLGHAWNIALIAYANVCRIWICSKYILRKSCSWYDELYICSENFQLVGLPWIPRNQRLPCDLRSWLFSDWQMRMLEVDTTAGKIFEQSFMEEVFDTNESLDTSNEFRIDFLNLSQESTSNINISSDESDDDINDIGEVITRETFERNFPKVSRNTEISLPRKT